MVGCRRRLEKPRKGQETYFGGIEISEIVADLEVDPYLLHELVDCR